MDIFKDHFQWHPKFFPKPINREQFLLLGETEQYLMASPHLEDLFHYLNQEKTVEEILSDPNKLPLILYLTQTLLKFEEAGYVQRLPPLEEETAYHCPDFSLPPVTILGEPENPQIQILSQFDGLDLLSQGLASIRFDVSMSVVIVDDYLDPRLALINQTYLRQQQPWLLIKPTGERPLVGPYFLPKSDSLCWQCLSYRMLKNQPVREWVQRQNGNLPFPIPTAYRQKEASHLIPRLQQLSDQLVAAKNTNTLFAINPLDLSVTKHPAIRRPQCQICGTPDQFTRQATEPVSLQSTLKIYTEDGGVRSILPSETNKNLSDFISPLSGIINHLTTHSSSQRFVNKIYRSSFFKTSYQTNQLQHNSFLQVSMGKGINEEQSKASALCESIERLSANYQGDEAVLHATVKQIEKRFFLPRQLAIFSETQYQEFANPEHPNHQTIHSVAQYQEEFPLHWAQVWSMTHQEPCYVPFTFCYANTPFLDERYCRFYHNGGAAGNTLEEAILQAYFELIERDATAIWWYNKIVRPVVDISSLPSTLLVQMEHTIGQAWDYWVLDLTHDFKVPVFAAISQHQQTQKFCLGLGCHLDATLACKRALTELCQIIEIREQHSAPFDFDQIQTESYLFPDQVAAPISLADFQTPNHHDIKEDILFCINQAQQLGLETLVLNYSRPDILIKTAKVIVPGMCHIFPYFAAERLYQVPVSLNWLKNALPEKQLNPHLLLI